MGGTPSTPNAPVDILNLRCGEDGTLDTRYRALNFDASVSNRESLGASEGDADWEWELLPESPTPPPDPPTRTLGLTKKFSSAPTRPTRRRRANFSRVPLTGIKEEGELEMEAEETKRKTQLEGALSDCPSLETIKSADPISACDLLLSPPSQIPQGHLAERWQVFLTSVRSTLSNQTKSQLEWVGHDLWALRDIVKRTSESPLSSNLEKTVRGFIAKVIGALPQKLSWDDPYKCQVDSSDVFEEDAYLLTVMTSPNRDSSAPKIRESRIPFQPRVEHPPQANILDLVAGWSLPKGSLPLWAGTCCRPPRAVGNTHLMDFIVGWSLPRRPS